MKKINLLSCIFTHAHGNGGHYFSFDLINKEIKSRGVNVKTLELGWEKSRAIRPDFYFNYNFINFVSLILKLRKLVLTHKIDIIHCYDEHSFLFMRGVSLLSKKPIILTRCGGSNPLKYYPVVSELVCFSEENLQYFSSKSKYSNLYLIPNRCSDKDFITEKSKLELTEAGVKAISIARIGKQYYLKHSLAIGLLGKEIKKNTPSVLYIVGVIEDESIYIQLKQEASCKNVKFLTTPQYTQKASRLIPCFDLVIGTGRGCMEAMGYGKAVLLIDGINKIPFLLTMDNFNDCFAKNFSLRVDGRKYINNLSDFELKTLGKWARCSYEREFSIESGVQKYIELYEQVTYGNGAINFRDGLANYIHNSYYFVLFVVNKLRKLFRG